jgi:hypothetical protein
MTLLSALIRKRDARNAATAIPAIPATQLKEETGAVARIATVTVANPTETEVAELRALVQANGKAEQWTADETERATAGALAVERGIIILPLDDDRRTCNQCTNLAKLRCLAAWRGEIVANRDYTPIRDIPRRCEGYIPEANDEDRRLGRERWPDLIESPGAANPAP